MFACGGHRIRNIRTIAIAVNFIKFGEFEQSSVLANGECVRSADQIHRRVRFICILDEL